MKQLQWWNGWWSGDLLMGVPTDKFVWPSDHGVMQDDVTAKIIFPLLQCLRPPNMSGWCPWRAYGVSRPFRDQRSFDHGHFSSGVIMALIKRSHDKVKPL